MHYHVAGSRRREPDRSSTSVWVRPSSASRSRPRWWPLSVPAIEANPAITQFYVKAQLDHLFPGDDLLLRGRP